MSMERLIELRDIVAESSELSDKTNLELAVWGSMLEKDEIPIKDFIAETRYDIDGIIPRSKYVTGELLLTDRRLIFTVKNKNGLERLELRYNQMDDFFVDKDKYDKEKGVIVIVSEGAYVTFTGLMRFGLNRWADYVNERIEEYKNKIKQFD